MVNDIFEEAYFGKHYTTRNGLDAYFLCKWTDNLTFKPYKLWINGVGERIYNTDGSLCKGEIDDLDIVINEDVAINENVTELTIGNWVCEDWDSEYESPFKVKSLTKYEWEHDGDWFETFISIPVTQKMLELNGFTTETEKDSLISVKTLNKTDYLRYEWKENKLYYISLYVNLSYCECKYVHEFQNALKLNKLFNESDNFKLK